MAKVERLKCDICKFEERPALFSQMIFKHINADDVKYDLCRFRWHPFS